MAPSFHLQIPLGKGLLGAVATNAESYDFAVSDIGSLSLSLCTSIIVTIAGVGIS